MKICLLIVAVLTFCLAGCGKKQGSGSGSPINAVEKYGGLMGRALKRSKASNEVMYLSNKINLFKRQEGRYPSSLNELAEKGIVDQLPQAPAGTQFVYDPATGKVEVK